MEAASAQQDADGWVLWNELGRSIRKGELAESCKGAYRDQATKLTPQGGCIGWQLTFRMPVEGGPFGT